MDAKVAGSNLVGHPKRHSRATVRIGHMTEGRPTLTQLNLVARDMNATLAFYRRLGLEIDADAGEDHVAVRLPNGLLLEFDSIKFVSQWDTGWRGSTGGSTVLGFALASRDDVDRLYADTVAAGHRGRQPPYDAFLGRAIRDRRRPGRQRSRPHESHRKRTKILAAERAERRPSDFVRFYSAEATPARSGRRATRRACVF